jgi:Secretion system C-terminal sorting domain
MPAFCAAGCEDAAAILCAHTRAKSVFVGALAAAGLVGTFHERCVLSGAVNSFQAENGSNKGNSRLFYVFLNRSKFHFIVMNMKNLHFFRVFVLAAIVIAFFAQNGFTQQWQSWQDSIGNNEQIAPVFRGEQIMTLDGAGNAWVLYELDVRPISYGLAKFDGKTWTHFDSTDGLMGGQLYAMTRDRSGNVWVSGDSGIATYSDGAWHTYQFEDQHTNIRIFGAIACDSSGNIWVASATRGFYYGRLNLTGNLNGLPIMNTIDTLVTQVFRFDGENWSVFPLDVIWHGNGVTSLAASGSGIIWAVGGPNDTGLSAPPIEGLWKLIGNSWTAFNLDDGNGTLQKASPGTELQAIAVHADGIGGAWVSFTAVNDNKSLSLIYPPAVNYFDGNEWDTSALTGARFSDMWLAPNGDKYFRSNPSLLDTSKGGLIITDASGNVTDSISKNNIPYFSFYHLDLASNGNIWLASEYDGPVLETIAAQSSVTPTHSSNGTWTCSIYPNPMIADAAHISFSGAQGGVYQITLTNTLGIVLKTASVNAAATASCNLSTSDLSSGAYLITVANGSERVTVPVVKE